MSEPAGLRQNLLEAVDYGLMVLGERVRQVIYERIEKHHGLKRAEIPEQLEAFHNALGSALGVGGETVERLIAKSFYRRLGLDFVAHPDWTLVEYVNHAKAMLESNQVHASSGS